MLAIASGFVEPEDNVAHSLLTMEDCFLNSFWCSSKGMGFIIMVESIIASLNKFLLNN